MAGRGRRRALAAIVVVAVAAGGALYLILASGDSDPPPATIAVAQPSSVRGVTTLPGSQLILRAVDPEDPRTNGRVFVIKEGVPQQLAGRELDCERVYFRGGSGLCLAAAEADRGSEVTIFDSSLHALHRFPVVGLPSRARVSPDGHFGAITVFVNGHAYLGEGGFSTATSIIDMRTGRSLGNLEGFRVTKDGRSFHAADFNFWGVTFAKDPYRFYVTLRTHGTYYLMEGDLARRTLRVLRAGVECPSLSPDGTRIAYKHRYGNQNRWRLQVLDLATLKGHDVGERRTIDDQVEWLDDETLVYSDGINVYTVAADGTGVPRTILRDASSPAALNP